MIIPKFPNPAEIALAIERCEAILADKKLNQRKNFALKEGYTECVRMMKERLVNPNNQFFVADQEDELEEAVDIYREQMLPIRKLTTKTGRTHAILCNDWLNGQDDEQSFLPDERWKTAEQLIDNFEKIYANNIIKDLLSNDGQRYEAVMDNQFKMAGTIRVVGGQVYLEQNEQHGKGQEDEVEKKYFCSVGDGSQAILDFMGISNFKVLDK